MVSSTCARKFPQLSLPGAVTGSREKGRGISFYLTTVVKNSHVLWGNWSINLLKPHSSCSLLQMEQAPLHVCLGSYKDCTQCAREDGSAPIPFCQKGIILLLKTKKNPTLQSDPRPAFWESPDHMLSLDGAPPQHLLALEDVQWLFHVYPMQPELHHV